MVKTQINKRYAKAVFDLSVDQGVIDRVLQNVGVVSEVISSDKSLIKFVKSPLSNKESLITFASVLSEKCSLDDLTSNFIKVLIENKRLGSILEINQELVSLKRIKDDIVKVEVTSIAKLSNKNVESLKGSLESVLESKLIIKNVIDKSIIGGLIIKIGSKMIDASLYGRINRLGLKLKEAI